MKYVTFLCSVSLKCLTQAQRIYFHGAVSIQILSGYLRVMGHLLSTSKSPYMLYSPYLSNALLVEAVGSASDSASVWLDPLEGTWSPNLENSVALAVFESPPIERSVISSTLSAPKVAKPTKAKQAAPSGASSSFEQDAVNLSVEETGDPLGLPGIRIVEFDDGQQQLTEIPHSWIELSSQVGAALNSSNPSQAELILVCGRKNSGKSSIMRFLTNSLLNAYETVLCRQWFALTPFLCPHRSHRAVAILDCDTGQSEYSPPGCVCLGIVRAPLFGQPFNHITQVEVVRSVFNHILRLLSMYSLSRHLDLIISGQRRRKDVLITILTVLHSSLQSSAPLPYPLALH